MRRCPLTKRFGKDVANEIYKMVWRDLIRAVNHEHWSTVRLGWNTDDSTLFQDEFGHYCIFNYRTKGSDRPIYSVANQESSA